jgi:hypothetical protein
VFCEETVSQWRRLGYETLVICQPDTAPHSPEQHGTQALALLEQASGASCLFCEDDVLVSVGLATFEFPDVVTTLYLPGTQFYPRRFRQMLPPDVPVCFPIIGLSRWFGSQCVYLPQKSIAQLLAVSHAATGFDILLRTFLLSRGLPLYSVYPNLIQHRAPKSVTSRRYQPHRSTTWRA